MPKGIVERDEGGMIRRLARPGRMTAFNATVLLTLVEAYREAAAGRPGWPCLPVTMPWRARRASPKSRVREFERR